MDERRKSNRAIFRQSGRIRTLSDNTPGVHPRPERGTGVEGTRPERATRLERPCHERAQRVEWPRHERAQRVEWAAPIPLPRSTAPPLNCSNPSPQPSDKRNTSEQNGTQSPGVHTRPERAERVEWAPAFIALGANLGDRPTAISSALDLLQKAKGIQLIKTSPLLENPAVGGPPDSPPFLNAAAQLQTTLPPQALLHTLLDIESHLGRTRRQRWEPRPIDLDLLLYGDLVLNRPGLTLPHPRMHQRRFVLLPLAEIAPDAIHPVLRKTIAQLLADLENHP